jgi:hypothetical protein
VHFPEFRAEIIARDTIEQRERTKSNDVVMAKGKFISYLRVSTDKQGRSGLGVEAQRAAV